MAFVSELFVYPVKSLDGVSISSATLSKAGALGNDREYALFTADGNLLHGKNCPKLLSIRAGYQDTFEQITISAPGLPTPRTINLLSGTSELEECLSFILEQKIIVRHAPGTGFPDDPAAYGPTIVSKASLETVAAWFPGMSYEEARRRFRVNIILDDAPAFFEDSLCGEKGTLLPFSIGEVQFYGTNPCARCSVPPRDSKTGETSSGFQKLFMTQRVNTLPAWAPLSQFDHFYRFTLNTITNLQDAGKTITIGDPVIS
ncbi:MAG: MOSC N-terminal beta barrel domain-containing protein [Ignavibacteria bacterium]|nr:MOSC N-terminal beta barrel domain-containing protein [Ignavibacteria bacterium]